MNQNQSPEEFSPPKREIDLTVHEDRNGNKWCIIRISGMGMYHPVWGRGANYEAMSPEECEVIVRFLKDHLDELEWRAASKHTQHYNPVVRQLRREVRNAQENNRTRNLELDGLHYVWCSGGCTGGAHRWPCEGRAEINEELVTLAEQNVKRLRSWWENRKWRLRQERPERPREGVLKRAIRYITEVKMAYRARRAY